MKITLGPNVTRAGIDETITGLWSFANVLGLLTDVIGERTAAAGVNVDGLLVKDAGIPEAAVTAHEAALAILESQITDGAILARLAADEAVTGDWTFDVGLNVGGQIDSLDRAIETDQVLRSRVTGDGVNRFLIQVGGKLFWGDGTAASDTNLYRSAASTLRTDDSLVVGNTLFLNARISLSERDISLSAQADDLDTGSTVVQRITASAPLTITGFAGGSGGRLIFVVNVGANRIRITNQAGGSVAANRVITPNAANMDLEVADSAQLGYDATDSRWRVASSTKIV